MISGILGNIILTIVFGIIAKLSGCPSFTFCLIFLIIGNILWIAASFLQGTGILGVGLGMTGVVFMSISLITFHIWTNSAISDNPGICFGFLPLFSVMFCVSYKSIGDWGDGGLSIGLTIGMTVIYLVLALIFGPAGYIIGYIVYAVACIICVIESIRGGSSAWG